MAEIIKLFLRMLFSLCGGWFYRLNEEKLTKPAQKCEQYPSSIAEVSRNQDLGAKVSYLGLRIPAQSEIRFSLLFPGRLSEAEVNYYLSKSWVNYFDDDRLQEGKSSGEGYFIQWSDGAVAAKGLFPLCWKLSQSLPATLVEIHLAQGYLRALFRAKPEEIARTDNADIKKQLQSFLEDLTQLPKGDARRGSLNDLFPFKQWILGAVILGIYATVIVLLMPTIDYFDYQKGDDLVIISAIGLAAISIIYNLFKRKGILNSIRGGIMFSFLLAFAALTLYERINFHVRTDGREEIWRVSQVTEKKARRTKQVTGQEVTLFGGDKRWNRLFVKKSIADLRLPQVGERVKVSVFEDLLGYYFGDSFVLEAHDGKAEIDLLK